MPDPWTWRVDSPRDNAALGLLYQPGNWGDVLKGEWALRLLDALPPGPLRLLDPFAGAPHWPLRDDAPAQVAASGPLADALRFAAVQAPHRARGLLASTARLLLDAAQAAGRAAAARVTDANAGRRARWSVEPHAELLPHADGHAALVAGWAEANLVLVDPYDLFERAAELLPAALAAAPQAAVLLYLYNKAPRSAALHRSYRELRAMLDALLATDVAQRRLLMGRIPSDAQLPRAFHEVLLVAPPTLAAALTPVLREVTTYLSRSLTDAGCFGAA